MKDFIWGLVGSVLLLTLAFVIYTLGAVHAVIPA